MNKRLDELELLLSTFERALAAMYDLIMQQQRRLDELEKKIIHLPKL